MHLPFPQGQSLFVIQGFDDPTGSHSGIAAFCWDLMLAGQPQSASNGIPFFAAASGTVDFVKQDNFSGGAGPANVISIKEADHEFCDYLHLRQNSAAVTNGAQVAFGTALADVGDTGAARGAFHLHMAVTNLGEGNKSSGGTFVTIPSAFLDYQAADDQGSTWRHVSKGTSTVGQWIRRPELISPRVPGRAYVNAVSRSADKLDVFVTDSNGVIFTAAWQPEFVDWWHGWWELRGGRAASGAPVHCVARNLDKVDVFVSGTDASVYTAAWEPAFTDWWHAGGESKEAARHSPHTLLRSRAVLTSWTFSSSAPTDRCTQRPGNLHSLMAGTGGGVLATSKFRKGHPSTWSPAARTSSTYS